MYMSNYKVIKYTLHIFWNRFQWTKNILCIYNKQWNIRKSYHIKIIKLCLVCTILLWNQPDHRRADQISNTKTVKMQRKNRTRSSSLPTSLQSCVTLILDSSDDIFSAIALRDSDTSLVTSFSEMVRSSGSWW